MARKWTEDEDIYLEYFELVEPPKKPTVPKCFDEFAKEYTEYTPMDAFITLVLQYRDEELPHDLAKWYEGNAETALEALQNGYEVEEEPKWIVRAGNNLIFKRFEDVEAIFVIDNQPGAIANGTQFETLEDAKNIIDILGDGEAARVEEGE